MILSCFKKGLCPGLGPLTADSGTQTNLTYANAIADLTVTTFFDKTPTNEHTTSTLDPRAISSTSSKQFSESKSNHLDKFKKCSSSSSNKVTMMDQDESSSVNFQPMNSSSPSSQDVNHCAPTATFGHNDNTNLVLSEDTVNNNFVNTSQVDLITSSTDVMEDVKNKIDNIYINDTAIRDVEMEENLTPKERELMQIIQIKDVKIRDLEEQLTRKSDEIVALTSQLDKFQSVFSISVMKNRVGNRKRAQGISAEPQSHNIELLNVNFPKYEKEQK